MPIYLYHCENCGFEQEQFLREDKESLKMKCKRCLKVTIAHQQRDDAVETRETDYYAGTVRHDDAETGV
jgi:putative FmdB family regulatory protein